MLEEKQVLISGPVGKLEVVIGPPLSSRANWLGIICHPHPLFEGTMNNKVVTTVARAFKLLDIIPVRFNFRGVGHSEGQYDHGLGEVDDLFSVIVSVKQSYPNYQLVLAGFSFGAYIAAKAASQLRPRALITIAPAVHHQDFSALPAIEFPWLLVQGEQDEIVPKDQVYAWVNSLADKPTLVKMAGIGHFFHGQLIALREVIVNFLRPVID